MSLHYRQTVDTGVKPTTFLLETLTTRLYTIFASALNIWKQCNVISHLLEHNTTNRYILFVVDYDDWVANVVSWLLFFY